VRTALKFLLTGQMFLSPVMVFAQTAYEVTPADETVLQAQEALTHVWRDKSRRDGALDVFGAIDVKASPAIIWNIMTDCARGNEIVKGMLSCDILEIDDAQNSDIRQQIFDMGPFLPNAKTQFRSQYTPYTSIKINRVGGDMKIQDALWTLTPRKNGLTRVSYRATILLKYPIPGAVIKSATRKDTPQIMHNLKRAAETDAYNLSNNTQFTQSKTPDLDQMP